MTDIFIRQESRTRGARPAFLTYANVAPAAATSEPITADNYGRVADDPRREEALRLCQKADSPKFR
jgi:hypothetical protein